MANHVHLVRHGEVHNPDHVVYASLPGFDLSGAGRSQAREVARYLRSAPIVAVWSSPLVRAITTAEPIAAQHRQTIRVDDELTEWRMADDWAGIRWDDLPLHRPGQLEAYLAQPVDLPFASESLPALARRMAAAITRLAARHEGDIVIVSHQDPVQAARLTLTGRSLEDQHVDKPGHGTVITLKPGVPWVEEVTWTPESSVPWTPVPAGSVGSDSEKASEQLDIGLERELGQI